MTLPTHIPAFSPSADSLMILAVVAATVIGMMIGTARLKLFIMSIYTGYVVALVGAPALHSLVGALPEYYTALGLLVLTIVALGLFGGNAYHRGVHSNMILNLLASVFAGLLLVVAGLSLLDPGALNATIGSSTIAMTFYSTRVIWFVAPAAALLIGNLIGGRRH